MWKSELGIPICRSVIYGSVRKQIDDVSFLLFIAREFTFNNYLKNVICIFTLSNIILLTHRSIPSNIAINLVLKFFFL
jgi:hypothetical protein